MRELTPQEVGLPSGGSSHEFRTLVRYEMPRHRDLPGRYPINAPEPRPEPPPEDLPEPGPEPVPLHWLPYGAQWPDVA